MRLKNKNMKKLLESKSVFSSLLVGFIFVQIVGLGLFFLIDSIFNNATPTLINFTLNQFWSDRGEGWLIVAPIYLIGYTVIGVIIKAVYFWHTKTFKRRK